MNIQCRFSRAIRLYFVLAVTVLLAACGGGGGGGTAPSVAPPPPGGGTTSSGFTISGTVVGLASGATVTLQNNGGDSLAVNANGGFTFPTKLSLLATYNVTVSAQPANGQSCAVTVKSGGSSTGSGTVSGSNIDTVRVSCASVFTFAGSGVSGHGDAAGEEAVFYGPSGIALDATGNLYVSDYYNNVLRKITSAGVVSTLAGSGMPGYVDATGTAAQFRLQVSGASRAGVAVDGAGNVYVADTGNNVIRKVTSAGAVTTLAGSGVSGYTNATGTAAKFSAPLDVAVDSSGNVYVADSNFSVIRKITAAGVVTTLAGSGSPGYVDATGTSAAFFTPYSVAVDASGNVYVADLLNSMVRMITPAGVVSTLAGMSGLNFADGPATTAKFYDLSGVAVDAAGNVYVADWGNRRVRKVSAQPYTYTVGGHVAGLSSGKSLVLQNNGGDNLTVSANGVFAFAASLTTATAYNVTILTQPAGQSCTVTNGAGSFTVGSVFTVKINCAAVSTLAGLGTAGYADGTGAAAQFRLATLLTVDNTGVAVDTAGNVYVADTFNHRIRKITSAGVVTTLAGSGTAGYTNATGTAAQFNYPRGIAVDGAGNVYVGDTANHVIRKITAAGVVTTLAGSGTAGNTNGTGAAAQFNLPRGVAVDASGNVYVADENNHVIRKITSAGVVTTLAGQFSGYQNSAVATTARFYSPYDVAVDTAGNVYVADYGNEAIRKITPAGAVTTLAGSQEGFQNVGYIDSTGTGVLFRAPVGVAVDAAGVLYVADHNNNVIRTISPAGTVATLAGSTAGYTNGNGATAQFSRPSGVAVDAAGSVYVNDGQNNVVRKIVQ